MNNPYSQHQSPYGENQRGGYGRNRNDRWSPDDYRGARSNWNEQIRGRAPWNEQDEYASQGRYSPNFDSFSESYGQDWQSGRRGRGQSDEYGYLEGNQGERGEPNWAESYADDYALPQQDYSLGEAPARTRFSGDNARWSQNRNYDDARYGRQGESQYERYAQRGSSQQRSAYGQQARPNTSGQQNWGGPRDWGSHQNWDAQGSAARGAFGQALHYGPQGGGYGQQAFNYDQQQRGRAETQRSGAYGLQEKSHRGKGPKGYVRTDERIREEICEWLSDDPRIDASEINVEVRNGVVTLEGTVGDRGQKHRVEDIADSCSGVKDVHNSLRVTHQRAVGTQAAGVTGTGTSTAGQSGLSGQGTTQPATSTQTRQ